MPIPSNLANLVHLRLSLPDIQIWHVEGGEAVLGDTGNDYSGCDHTGHRSGIRRYGGYLNFIGYNQPINDAGLAGLGT